MTRAELFEAWAPARGIWSPWAKPVLFSQMTDIVATLLAEPQVPAPMSWAPDPTGSTAIVVDIAGEQSVAAGLALAASGYRPVPLYNACPAPFGEPGVVQTRSILLALSATASVLTQIEIADDAPPAFLLDAGRNPAAPLLLAGHFDNRSISLPTDFPSANLLASRGIRRAVLLQSNSLTPATDLSHTLRRWQEADLPIDAISLSELQANASALPHRIAVQLPRNYKVFWYNLLATIGLRSSPLGGFGGRLPMPSSG